VGREIIGKNSVGTDSHGGAARGGRTLMKLGAPPADLMSCTQARARSIASEAEDCLVFERQINGRTKTGDRLLREHFFVCASGIVSLLEGRSERGVEKRQTEQTQRRARVSAQEAGV
jgi:hypothetical protein